MGKHTYDSSSSCSSSSSSDCGISCPSSSSSVKLICKAVSKPCKPIIAKVPKDSGVCPAILAQSLAPAVVTVQSTIVLTTSSTPDVDPVNPITLYYNATGFLIAGGNVITTAAAVLIPPTFLRNLNRFPYVDRTPVAPTGNIPNQSTLVSQIIVTVTNVNNRNCDFAYLAQVKGVSGIINFAVLRIVKKCETDFNACNPPLKKCHPYFEIGCSTKDLVQGQKLYTLGDLGYTPARAAFAVSGATSFAEGTLEKRRTLDYSGWILAELMTISGMSVPANKTGLPVFDSYGCIQGMIVTSPVTAVPPLTLLPVLNPATQQITRLNGTGTVSAITEFAMRRALKAILGGCSCKFANQLESIPDAFAGAWYRFVPSYLGFSYREFTGIGFTTNLTEVGVPNYIQDNPRFDGTGGFTIDRQPKAVVGLQVTGIAGGNLPDLTFVPPPPPAVPVTGYYIPGGNPGDTLFPGFPETELPSSLEVGDVIYQIGKCDLGDHRWGYTPLAILCNIAPPTDNDRFPCSKTIRVSYFPANTNWCSMQTTSVTPLKLQPINDQPWYNWLTYDQPSTVTVSVLPAYNFVPSV